MHQRAEQGRRQAEEARELGREHIVPGGVEPGAGLHFFFVVAWLRHMPEPAVGDQAQLVVVVEHRPAVARHAEILQQQVAGEDIAQRQVADRLAVVDHRRARGLRGLFAHVQVERAQPAFDVAQVQHQVVAVQADAAGAGAEQFVEQVGGEARAREAQEPERLRVDQAADAVVLEHQRVLGLDLLARDLLRVGEAIADQLEHQRIAGQGEHRHDHAALALGADQALAGLAGELAEEGAVALGLALLGPAEHGVQLVDGLTRQQGAQEHHRVADRAQVGMEITARVAEQLHHFAAQGQHRIDPQRAAVVDQGDHAGRERALAEHAPDQIRAPLAVEHRVQQLDRAHRMRSPVLQVLLQPHRDPGRATGAVRVRHRERVVAEHAHEGVDQAFFGHRIAVARHRMGDGVGRLDVEGDEFDRRIHAAGLEEAPGEGIEESLVQLAVEQRRDRFRVGGMHRRPQRAIAVAFAQARFQRVAGFGNAAVVQLDALERVVACAAPVAALEPVLGATGDRGEAGVVVGEGVADLAGDGCGFGGVGGRGHAGSVRRRRGGCGMLAAAVIPFR